MADKIGNLLDGKKYDEPEEIAIIKEFLARKFNAAAETTVGDKQIIIAVRGAALAGTLRLHIHELKVQLATDKRLIIRII